MFPGTPGFSLVGVAQPLAPPHPVTQFGGFDLILIIKNVTITDSEYRVCWAKMCSFNQRMQASTQLCAAGSRPQSRAWASRTPGAGWAAQGRPLQPGWERGAASCGSPVERGRGLVVQREGGAAPKPPRSSSAGLWGGGGQAEMSSDCFQQAHEPCSLSRSSRSA